MPFLNVEDLRIRAFSYSRIKTYTGCPAKAKYKFIHKLKEPGSIHAERGIELHKQCEDYLNAEEETMVPAALSKVGRHLNQLRVDTGGKFATELQVGFNKDWETTDWFAPDVYMRVVYDFLGFIPPDENRAIVCDHKSGKEYDDHADQLGLYALSVFKAFPDVEEVDARIIYIDLGKQANSRIVYRSEADALQTHWDEICERIVNDDVMAPNPGRACRWCHFAGDPCPHGA